MSSPLSAPPSLPGMQPPPPAPAPPKSGVGKWVAIGCGGCGCLTLIIITLIAGCGVMAVDQAGPQFKTAHGDQLAGDIERFREVGLIPPEQDAQISGLAETCTEETTSGWAVVLTVASVEHAIEDGEISAADEQLLDDVETLLADSPDTGVVGFALFIAEHPEIQKRIETVLNQMQ
jgi:hypothetical protein